MRLALAIACAIFPLGCRQLLSSDSYQFATGGDSDGAGGSGGDSVVEDARATEAGDDGAPGCKLARPLDRTITAEVPGNNELVFVSHNMDVTETTDTDGIPRYLKLG